MRRGQGDSAARPTAQPSLQSIFRPAQATAGALWTTVGAQRTGAPPAPPLAAAPAAAPAPEPLPPPPPAPVPPQATAPVAAAAGPKTTTSPQGSSPSVGPGHGPAVSVQWLPTPTVDRLHRLRHAGAAPCHASACNATSGGGRLTGGARVGWVPAAELATNTTASERLPSTLTDSVAPSPSPWPAAWTAPPNASSPRAARAPPTAEEAGSAVPARALPPFSKRSREASADAGDGVPAPITFSTPPARAFERHTVLDVQLTTDPAGRSQKASVTLSLSH
jgi:hypothetical protein